MRKQAGSNRRYQRLVIPRFGRPERSLHLPPARRSRSREIKLAGGEIRKLALGHEWQELCQLQRASHTITSSLKLRSRFREQRPKHLALPKQEPTRIQLGEFLQDGHYRRDAQANAPRQFREVLTLPPHTFGKYRLTTAGILYKLQQPTVHDFRKETLSSPDKSPIRQR